MEWMSLDEEEFDTDRNWIIKHKDVILTNPLPPRHHIDIILLFPYQT